jgi:hypothetical protein
VWLLLAESGKRGGMHGGKHGGKHGGMSASRHDMPLR